MTTTVRPLDLHRFRCANGTHATGWAIATWRRRLAASSVDALLFLLTLGVGWSLLFWRTARQGATPGKSLLGLSLFSTDERHQSTRRRVRWPRGSPADVRRAMTTGHRPSCCALPRAHDGIGA